MAHAQKPDFVFRRNGGVHLNRLRGPQFSRILATEVCASAVVMLDTTYSEVVWRVLATHSMRQFPLHFPSYASTCAITFQLDFTNDGGDRVDISLRVLYGRKSSYETIVPIYRTQKRRISEDWNLHRHCLESVIVRKKICWLTQSPFIFGPGQASSR